MPSILLNRGILRANLRDAIDKLLWPIPQPLLSPFGPGVGTVAIVKEPGFVAFKLNGKLAWLIDVKRFAGNPTLTARQDPNGQFRIKLQNARFPGTELPADFVCLLGQKSAFGTPMDLRFKLGGFHAQTIFERWLAHQALAQSAVALKGDICPLGAASKLAAAGAASARFFPNWLFQISGSNLATVTGLAPDMRSDTVTLKLLFPGDPSLSSQPKSKRALLALTAGANLWKLKPQLLNLPIGTLTASEGLFDRIDIEAGESASGDAARVLVASSSRDDGLSLKLTGNITDLDANPLLLALTCPVYAIAFDPTPNHSQGEQTMLLSHFAREPLWLFAAGFGMQVGDVADAPSFEVETLKGAVTSVRCEPALVSVAAPLAGQVEESIATKPIALDGSVTLPIVAAPGTAPGWGLNVGPAVAAKPHFSLSDFRVTILRVEDLLSLDFLFYNVALESGGGIATRLARKDASKPAYLVAEFDAPQNIAEQAFLEDYQGDPHPPDPVTGQPPVTGEPVSTPPVRTAAAGPSRLAFEFPRGTDSIVFSLAALLDWVKLQQSVVPVAQSAVAAKAAGAERVVEIAGIGLIPIPFPPPFSPAIREPGPTETAIEAPWRLFLSPNEMAAWAHSTQAVTHQKRTELWHTRLAVRAQKNGKFVADENAPREIRAVWSPDYTDGPVPGHTADPVPPDFRGPLDSSDRDQIVRLSSDLSIANYKPQPIDAKKLFLTSLGAWMDVQGDWDPHPLPPALGFSLEEWRHQATMARDNYVRVVYAGYLFPFGNRASLVKVTERKLQSINNGPTTAYLRQTFFIIVREPEKAYDAPNFLTAEQQRGFPFRKARITTLVTPSLVSPSLDPFGKYSFFPKVKVSGNFFQFHIVGRDVEEQTSEFTTPLYFVELNGDYNFAIGNWQGGGQRTRDLAGQKVAYAASSKPGDTTLPTANMTVDAAARTISLPFGPPVFLDPPVFPQMSGAAVNATAIQQLAGQTGPVAVKLYDDFVANDFKGGGVFLQMVSTLPVGFRGDQSGGVATPNLQVNGLSRRFGAVSGTLSNIGGGNFDPADFFGDVNATLFGVVPLAKLIAAVFGDGTVPAVITERVPANAPTALQTRLEWTPVVQDFNDIVSLTFDDPNKALQLKVLIVTPLDGTPPQTSVSGSLSGFTLSLAKVIGIHFTSFSFNAPAGKKLDVQVDLPPTDDNGPIEFQGDLSFLNQLRKFIPSDGFQDPPSLDVSADGVTAGYSLAIPSIGVGVFSLENIRLSAALTLPFLPPAALRFRFAFSERDHPFLITVSLLGGGGFFGIALGPDGVEMLDAALEFGANASINVVVASGNVHIMAGVYLKIEESTNHSQLTGFLRAGGSLDVLGLISASVEFYLGFAYYFGPPCEIAGEATVTIEVHVVFFSTSVSASLRREFADPRLSFADLISRDDWNYYCDSFAA
jgi:hypothetical protein